MQFFTSNFWLLFVTWLKFFIPQLCSFIFVVKFASEVDVEMEDWDIFCCCHFRQTQTSFLDRWHKKFYFPFALVQKKHIASFHFTISMIKYLTFEFFFLFLVTTIFFNWQMFVLVMKIVCCYLSCFFFCFFNEKHVMFF